jgi:MtrB/PioB family decaheme-associated outer membrane protein
MSNGVFGDINLLFDTEEYYLGLSVANPNMDDRSYEAWGGRYGLGKIRFYYDELVHNYSLNALKPYAGVGGNDITIPTPVPPVSEWYEFDYDVKKKKYGVDVTLDQEESPFYYKTTMEEQKSKGTMPWGTTNYTGFELPVPVDYTTDIFMFESGYRSNETTAVVMAGYSKFNDHDDILTVTDGTDVEEYSLPADNYSYNLGGRVVQRLPMDSLLALKASYSRNKSDPKFGQFTTITSPTADGEYDGDVEYIRAGAVLNTQWSAILDTRLYYNYIDRDNKSEQITSVDGGVHTNHLFHYDKNEAGVDANYRLNKSNKLSGGYDFSYTDRNREDAQTTMDNTVFTELKNTSLDWMSAKLRLEYLNRDSDSDYSSETLEGDGEIHKYFTPFDYASKNRYKAKIAFDFYATENLGVSLSYALIYDDYDATELGIQDDQRQEVYFDVNALLPAKIRLNAYAGYEYSKTKFDSRRFNPGSPDPDSPTTPNDYNWSQDTTYDFFVIGGSLTVPVIERLDMVFNADYQRAYGNIEFNRPDAAGDSLKNISDADDYYKTQLGVKGIYQATDAWTVTLGYLYEKFDLNEWGYNNYNYDNGSYYLSGAGLDSDYETSQVYVITTFHF